MSYVLFPPRTDNFFPPGPPYLAGLRGMRGLGDYDSDLKAYRLAVIAYNRNMLVWNAAKKKHEDEVASYAAAMSSIGAAQASDQAAYQRDLADWNKEFAVYTTAVSSWKAACKQILNQNAARATAIAKSYSITLPDWFVKQGYCASQTQINSYAKNCQTVRGIGYLQGLGSSDPNCGWKGMPICSFPSPPTLRAKPTEPAAPTYPAKPSKLPPMPVAPVAPTKPIVTTTPVTSGGGGGGSSLPDPGAPSPSVPSSDPATKNAGMIANGLILVAVGVGGYLVYRTLKKPKAQAA